ncbi:MAG: triose-phosphate isomerase [Minisyncoccia bacterium]|jgi:triosephosphate isomerase
MRKLIVANWKMNPQSLSRAIELAKASDKKKVVIVPPFVFTEEVGKVLKKAELGAQDVSREDPPAGGGPYTGEVSWRELKRLGVKYVIIGHSERRALGENDSIINKKLKVTLAHGFKAILCVGEKWSARKRGAKAAESFVKRQINADLKGIKNRKLAVKNLIVAYEPVWAIGTGKNDTPKDAYEMAGLIKKQVTGNKREGIQILYGGSVNSKNAKLFLAVRGIDGLLVGGTSLKTAEFKKIISLVK